MPADRPARAAYDVVIVGGAIMGSATAFFLTDDPAFTGRVLVVEPDPSCARAGTGLTNSCIRQQFSTAINVRISQFGAAFFEDLPARMRDARVPAMRIQNFGYMYLAATESAAAALREAAAVQREEGAATRLLTPDAIAAEYPFYATDDLLLGSINTDREGYFDGYTMFDWMRRLARERGVDYIADRVTGLEVAGDRVTGVRLASGETVGCGAVVNAAGTRGAEVAAMAGLAIPVEPRKRYTWVFTAATPLPRALPLTIDPSGVHVRQDGAASYMAGAHTAADPAVDPDDFAMDHAIWEEHVWPALATRIPAFAAIRVQREWAGHYDMNVLDANAICGPHPGITNFHFLNGFSGHGLQQAPAMGRGAAEMLVHGRYLTLDLSPFGFDRIAAGRPFVERAII
jgi:glycine/D-amino acid oxidase-like deaminating enzyme